jgi:plasmid stabilization system protein ParE
MRVVYHPEAEAELVDAVRFYEEHVAGLGDRFLREFQEAIDAIASAPEMWPLIEGSIRRYSMRRFPYAIYYRAAHTEVQVLVVMHQSRNPDYWKHRRDM